MYHLRRSHFITTFGVSPDETTFYRVIINNIKFRHHYQEKM